VDIGVDFERQLIEVKAAEFIAGLGFTSMIDFADLCDFADRFPSEENPGRRKKTRPTKTPMPAMRKSPIKKFFTELAMWALSRWSGS
jgi:hypothetical protein